MLRCRPVIWPPRITIRDKGSYDSQIGMASVSACVGASGPSHVKGKLREYGTGAGYLPVPAQSIGLGRESQQTRGATLTSSEDLVTLDAVSMSVSYCLRVGCLYRVQTLSLSNALDLAAKRIVIIKTLRA
jgi:hypothetical protein